MGGGQSASDALTEFSRLPDPVSVPQDNTKIYELLKALRKCLTAGNSENIQLFVQAYRNSMKTLLGIMRHPNSQIPTVVIGFEILNDIIAESDGALDSMKNNNGLEFIQKVCSIYDYRDGRVKKVNAAIQLIITITKKDAKAAESIIEKGLIGILTPLIMEIEVPASDTERIELIRNATRVFSEMTDIRDDKILKLIANETGVVGNFVLLLNDFHDIPTLGYSLNTIANLSDLPQVQMNQFLVKNGVQNVLQIIELNQDKWLQLQACKTLRVFCSTRLPQLALQLKSNQTIDKLMSFIEKQEEPESQIAFYCKLSLLELCHSKDNQDEIEEKGGIDHFLSLTCFEPTTLREKVLVSNTILQFSCRSAWIKIAQIFPYFVKIIMKNMREGLQKNFVAGTTKQKKGLNEKLSKKKMQDYSIEALKNLSLTGSSHTEIFQNENLGTLLIYLRKIDMVFNSQKHFEKFRKKKGDMYICVLKVIGNCLMTREICENLDNTSKFNKKYIAEYIQFLHTYHKLDEKVDVNSAHKEFKGFYEQLQNESTLALCLIERCNNSFASTQTDEAKAGYLISILKTQDDHQVCKALNVLGSLATSWNVVQYLYRTKIAQVIKDMLAKNEPSITRETAFLISQLLVKPENMILWLKFDAFKVGINAADSEKLLVEWGKPKRLPKDRGIFRNWGAFFDTGDILEIPGGLQLPNKEWSISAWLILPMPFITGKRHVLVQSSSGKGGYFVIDETGSRLGCIDEKNGLFIDSGVDLNKYRKGWHQVTVTCDNQIQMKVKFYIDGKQNKESQDLICNQTIQYIGNSRNGQQPFGAVSDLRIYPFIVSNNFIQSQAKYHDELEFEMPDKFLMLYLEYSIIDTLIERLKTDVDSTIIMIIKTLTRMSTKKECRSRILQCGGLEIALKFLDRDNDDFSFELFKLIYNIQ